MNRPPLARLVPERLGSAVSSLPLLKSVLSSAILSQASAPRAGEVPAARVPTRERGSRELHTPGEGERVTGAGGVCRDDRPPPLRWPARGPAPPRLPPSAGPGRATPGRPVPLTTRRPLSVPCLKRPDRGVTCVPGRPPGGGGGRGRGGKRGGKWEGAEGGGRSAGRILRPWEAAAAAASGSRGAGPRRWRWRRKGPERGRESEARRKPETAGGPVAGPGREPGLRKQRPRGPRRGRRIQRSRRRPGSARSGGRRARAGGMEPQHVHPAPCARCSAWEEPVGTAPRPPPPTPPLLPPGPCSVQEMARDEVPSCFPAGAALPPPRGLLLARRPLSFCPLAEVLFEGTLANRRRRPGSPFLRFLDLSTL